MASTPSRTHITKLYSNLIRASRSFASYNFRSYFIRTTREKFRAHLHEADPSRITALYKEGLEELDVLRRAAITNRLYEGPKLVVEKPRLTIGGGGSGMDTSVGGGGQPV
ncbi:hypothetical protein FRB96_004062 [Tulasnella sp. 330]|nr:hypothetical protein FRB96_004062 [Tulasnella sp. 330]KAG8876399.1 hypothetical protein FRB97_004202 [Tulasnella sp. 331]KAG8881834.1 hypothetical protein FRB98_004104 [Tulasnella sp. 332]